MAQLAKATSELTLEEKDQVQVAMITVDPNRDSKEVMADYMGHFDPTFLGLTGTEEEIAEVADAYGVFYEKQEGGPETDYLVNHTASVFVIDKDGYLRMLYPFSTPGENMASDLRQLVKE
jgi:protein SCO1/2